MQEVIKLKKQGMKNSLNQSFIEYQNQIGWKIRKIMAMEENKVLRLKVYHQVMGIQNLELNSKDTFSDLRVLLLENTPLTIFENFRFQIANKLLPEFQQIGQVIHSDAKINIQLMPFDQKSSLYHLEKIKNIFANPIQWALLNYNRDQEEQFPELSDTSSQSLLQNITIDNFTENQFTSPLYLPLLKSFQSNLQQKFHSSEQNDQVQIKQEEKQQVNKGEGLYPRFLEFFTFSQFNLSLNGSNFHRKISGDLFYLHAKTLQGRDYHITACAQGYYINNSSNTHYNPTPTTPNLTYYNLLDLFKTISPKFRDNLEKLKQIKFNQIQKSIFSSFRVKPDQQFSNEWLRNRTSAVGLSKNAKNSHFYNFSAKNNPFSQNSIKASWMESERETERDSLIIKDWNQIIQIHTAGTFDIDPEHIHKNKFKFKLYQQLQNSVRDGALKIVQGIVTSAVQTKWKKKQNLNKIIQNQNRTYTENAGKLYKYGSLEFWIADQSFFAYRTLENEMPSKRKVSSEINNLEVLDKLKFNDVFFRNLMLVKYKGYCVAAQTIIPGYKWSADKKKTQETNLKQKQNSRIYDNLSRLLKLSPKTLYYQNQQALQKNQISRSSIHPELEIFEGNDGRKYLLNLSSLSPRDLNFAGAQNSACCLRRELIEIFEAQPYNNKFYNVPTNSMLQGTYKIAQNQKTKEEKLKLIQLAMFARETMVPNCLKSFQGQNKKYLGDSKSVVKIMHSFGLSSRYLGMLWKNSMKTLNCPHISIILQRVILVKSLKSVLRRAMRQNKSGDLQALLAWLFNCIFKRQFLSQSNNFQKLYNSLNSYPSTQKQQAEKDQSQTTHSKKRKKKFEIDKNMEKQFEQNYFTFRVNTKREEDESIGIGMKPEQIWKLVKKISHFKFGMEFKEENIDALRCFTSQFSKSAVLRDLCISLGIVIERTQYFSTENIIFRPQNILDLKPIIKHIKIENQHFTEMLKQAEKLLEVKKIEESIDAYIKSIHFAMLNLGVMTENFVLAHKKLSEIYFRIGEIDAALLFAHHGENLLEKYYGVEHIETLQIFSLLSQLYFMKKKFNVAQYYLLKMLNLAIVSYGEEYPEIISSYLNLSTIYQISERFIDSISCAVKALNLSLKIFGENNLNTAICYAALSQIHFQIPDIQKSITFQKKSIEILKKIIKETDPRIKEAESTLEFYKNLQSTKKVKQCHEKERKRISNSQLYAKFPLFKIPEYTWKQRENIYRRMQNVFWNPNNRQFA